MTIDQLLSWRVANAMASKGWTELRALDRPGIMARLRWAETGGPSWALDEEHVKALKFLRTALHQHRETAIVVEDLPVYELVRALGGRARRLHVQSPSITNEIKMTDEDKQALGAFLAGEGTLKVEDVERLSKELGYESMTGPPTDALPPGTDMMVTAVPIYRGYGYKL